MCRVPHQSLRKKLPVLRAPSCGNGARLDRADSGCSTLARTEYQKAGMRILLNFQVAIFNLPSSPVECDLHDSNSNKDQPGRVLPWAQAAQSQPLTMDRTAA